MRINFFCEFPDEDLEKAGKVNFESTIYIAADSLEEYRMYCDELQEINPDLEPAYWPIVKGTYWVSPFTKLSEIQRIFQEIMNLDDEVLLDLELPFIAPLSFLKGIRGFRRKKKLIKSALQSRENKILTNEYPDFPILNKIFSFFGVRYPDIKHQTYYMHFASWLPDFLNSFLINRLNKSSETAVNLGTITKGVFGYEPVLTPQDMKKNLTEIQKKGISTISIIRLGGLDDYYLDILEDFSD